MSYMVLARKYLASQSKPLAHFGATPTYTQSMCQAVPESSNVSVRNYKFSNESSSAPMQPAAREELHILAAIDVIRKAAHCLEKGPGKDKQVVLNAHPFIAAYLTKGFPSIRQKWYLDHKKWIKIQPLHNPSSLDFR